MFRIDLGHHCRHQYSEVYCSRTVGYVLLFARAGTCHTPARNKEPDESSGIGLSATFSSVAVASPVGVLRFLGFFRRIGVFAFNVLDPCSELLYQLVTDEFSVILIHFGGDGDLTCKRSGDVSALPIWGTVDLGVLIDDSVLWRLLSGLEMSEHGLLSTEELYGG